MYVMRTVTRACYAALIASIIAACSGGGGGGGAPPPPQFSVSPTSLSFSASGPNAATPPMQTLIATVNGVSAQTLFIRIVVTGTAVANVTNPVITGPTTGQATVIPASPAVLGPGMHSSVITVTACTTDINCSGPQLTGSPVTVNVTYQVGAVPAPPNAIAPSVGTAGVPGEIIIRGSGFGPGTSVTFDVGVAAPSVLVVSSSELRATYPVLPAGTHAVNVIGNAVPFTASLHLVDPGTFTTTTLAYPPPVPPQNMRGLAFDARRSALIVGTGFSSPGSNQVLRYAFDGTNWHAPQQITLANLRDLTLAIDGNRLLTVTDAAVVELDPATLTPQAITPRTTNIETLPSSFLRTIVAANDGQALVVSSGPNSGGQHWLYAVATRTFSMPFGRYSFPVAGGAENGSRAVIVQEGVSPAQAVQQYNASSGFVSSTRFELAHLPQSPVGIENVNPPVFDRSGSRMVVAAFLNTTAYPVYDANFGELGRLPSVAGLALTASYALSPDGQRAFTLEIGGGVCRVRAFDLSAPPGPGVPFPETVPGFPMSLGSCPASTHTTPIRMLLNPSGNTLFIAGNLAISVVRVVP